MSDNRPHSVHGFSKLDSIADCRHFLSDPENDTQAADRGRLIHEQIGRILNSPLPDAVMESLTSPDKEAICWGANTIRDLVGGDLDWLIEWQGDARISGVWGYLDLLNLDHDTPVIVEIKSGWTDRRGARSYQIMGQVLAVLEEFPLVDHVEVFAVEVDKRQVDTFIYARSCVAALRTTIMDLFDDARPYSFSGQCSYCQQRFACDAPKMAITQITGEVLLDAPQPSASTEVIASFLSGVDADMKAAVKFYDGLKDALIARLKKEGDGYGWKINARSRGQQWRDEDLVTFQLSAMLPNMVGFKPTSPAQFRKVAATAGLPKSQIEDFIERNATEIYATGLKRVA